MINKHKSNKIKENSNTVRHLNNGTDHRHSKSCCDQSSPARRTINPSSVSPVYTTPDCCHHYTPRTTKLLGGILVSLRPSVRPFVRLSVRLSRLSCPLCNIYSSGWILSILAINDHYHKRVCHTRWPVTLTYIFKVIRPWLRKLCPLCNVFSSRSIISIFAANNHYH